MDLKLELAKFKVRNNRKKDVLYVKKHFQLQGKEIEISRKDNDSIQTYLYYPVEVKDNMPLLINVHGGAWVGGDALVLDGQSKKFAEKLNCVVVNLNYKKADMKPLPYCQNEARDTIMFFYDNASKYGIDRNRIAVIGYSAGGQICASAVQMAHDAGYDVSCQVLCYPFVDFTCDNGKQKELIDMLSKLRVFEKLLFQNISKTDSRVSPALYKDLKNLPPAIIVKCGRDILDVQASQYHNLLVNSGCKSTLLFYKDACHGFMEVNYPETFKKQEAKNMEQEAIMLKCESDIFKRLNEIWEEL